MRFLVDANMPRSAAACIRECGHEAVDVRDIGLGQAPDRVISQYAQQKGLTLITRDKDFGHVRNYPPANYAGIVVLDLRDDAVAAEILRILRAFLGQTAILARLHGRLAIVEAGRIRLRPA
jgi:predicted nuclease of predicted toxin-antitoxin system